MENALKFIWFKYVHDQTAIIALANKKPSVCMACIGHEQNMMLLLIGTV